LPSHAGLSMQACHPLRAGRRRPATACVVKQIARAAMAL
jgi:hypothetical protein